MNTKKVKRKSEDKSRLMKGREYLKTKMKEHFKFLNNYSPELKKKRKGSSLSPPKGKN